MIDLSAALNPDSTGNIVPVWRYVADWQGAFEEFDEIPGVFASFAKNAEDNVVEIAVPRAGINAGTDVRPWLYVVGNENWDNEEYVPNTIVDGWGGADGEYYAINYNFINGASVKRLGDKSVVTAVDDKYPNSTVDKFGLVSNFPNPFNPSTTIEFTLPQQNLVKVEIYNILGSKIATLIDNQELSSGIKRITWNGKNDKGEQVVSGAYIYRITSGDISISKKMMLLK